MDLPRPMMPGSDDAWVRRFSCRLLPPLEMIDPELGSAHQGRNDVTILLLATGGTISSVAGSDGLPRAALRGKDLLARVPELRDRTDLVTEDVATLNSWAFDGAHMLAIAQRVVEAVTDPAIDGVVVTHGTDTLEETAFLTDLLIGTKAHGAGVVFTGAMRTADELSPDGDRNLACAIRVAGDPAARGWGALVCLDDLLHTARDVVKTSSSGVGALRSPNGPVGRVEGAEVHLRGTPPERLRCGPDVVLDVPMLCVYPGMDGAPIAAAVERGARGIVIEGTGLGNVPPAVAEALIEALGRGIPVVIARRPREGRAAAVYGAPGGGGSLAAHGAVPAGPLPAHKARIALTVALGADPTIPGVREWFAQL